MTDTKNYTPIFRSLEDLLKKECALYERYLMLLKEEREAVVSMKIDTITEKSWDRSNLNEQLQEISLKRIELLKNFPEGSKIKISEIIARYCDRSEAARISPIVKKLKSLVEQTRKQGQELTQVLSFSQRLVGGMVSLLSSASQSVTKLYNRKGSVSESYQPSSASGQGSIKEA